jgi:RNA polymerase sigma-70 factor (ECF subfamily)
VIIEPECARDRAISDMRDELFDAFELHKSAMFGVARSVVGHDLATDVVQDVLTRVWHNIAAFDPARGSMRAYLMTVTRGMSIDALRQSSARRCREERDHLQRPCPTHEDALRNLIRDEEALRLSAAMAALRPADRDLVHTAFYGDETYRQIADRLGMPEGTVKTRIRTALHTLRRSLADLRPEHTDAEPHLQPAVSRPR